jgi:hypothetical protein
VKEEEMADAWTLDELKKELTTFEAELRAARLRETSVRTYVDRSSIFLRWLAGDYHPRAPRT